MDYFSRKIATGENAMRQLICILTIIFTGAFAPYYPLDFDPAQLNGITAEQMQQLLDNGLPVNYNFTDSSNLLMQAAARSQAPVVGLLLQRGASFGATDKYGNSALIYAARYNPDPDVINTLVDGGILVDKPDFEGATPLFYAARYNPNPQVTGRLVDLGANVNHNDQQNLTPLIMAAITNLPPEQRNTSQVISALINAGAYPDALYNGLNALEYAKRNPNLKNTQSIELLQTALNTKTF